MLNIFDKNPIKIHIQGIENNHLYTKKTITFSDKKTGGDDDEFDIMNIDIKPDGVVKKDKEINKKSDEKSDKKSDTTNIADNVDTDNVDTADNKKTSDVPHKKEEIYSSFKIFPEDSVWDFKKIIYEITNIEMYKQHLYYIENDKVYPVQYYIEGSDINIDIRKLSNEKLYGVPILRDNYVENIYAADAFTSMEKLFNSTTEFYLLSIDEIYDSVDKSKFLTDFNFKLAFNFVQLYWPMISEIVFNVYLSNAKGIAIEYPNLIGKLTEDRSLLDIKYLLMKDAMNNFKKHPKLREYNPHFIIDKKHNPKSILMSGIKQAILTSKNKFSITKVNLQALFEESKVSHHIPIIRYCNKLSLTKTLTVDNSKYVQETYEYIKIYLNDYDQTISYVVNVNEKEKRFIIVRINEDCSVQVHIVWKEEDYVDFNKTFNTIVKNTNPIIEKINNYGRKVFETPSQLSNIRESNSEYQMLNISIYWKKVINRETFNLLKEFISTQYKGQLKPRDIHESDVITFYYHKVTDYDKTQIDKSILGNNQYAYLFDAAVKQRFEQLFDYGRVVNITHRTTDVVITAYGIREKEFDYFYEYIVTLLYLFENKQVVKDFSHVFDTYEPYGAYNVLHFHDKINNKKNKETASSSPADILDRIKNKNILKTLKAKDPDGFNIKQFNSDIVYSRICQKSHQPVPFSPDELKSLPDNIKNKLTKYWNFTTQNEMYYLCPNTKFPYLTFIEGHPKNYCLPCCKKNPAYRVNVSKNLYNKKEKMYFKCLSEYCYTAVEEDVSSRYIMNYGKEIDNGRIGRLPEIFEKYIIYNIADKQIISDSANKREFIYNGFVYSVDKLLRYTRNIKIYMTRTSDLYKVLDNLVWTFKTPNQGEISPRAVIENPRLSPNHYNRIVNADLNYPIIVYRKGGSPIVIDGMHRLANAYINKIEKIKVRYVTEKQLSKVIIRKLKTSEMAEVNENVNLYGKSRKKIAAITSAPQASIASTMSSNLDIKMKTGSGSNISDFAKNAGYFLYGVPQNAPNINNVGAVFSIATALEMDYRKYVTEIIKNIPEVFSYALSGTLNNYFRNPNELITVLNYLFLDIGSKPFIPKFHEYNELFIDLTLHVFQTYVITYEDLNLLTIGTSIKNTTNRMNILLPPMRSIEDVIPLAAPNESKNKYILLIKKSQKLKSVFGGEIKNYYPIFIFIPQIFSKTNEIDQRIYTQNDELIKLTRSLVSTKVVYANDLRAVIKFCNDHQEYSIVKYYSDKHMVNGVLLEVVGSSSKYAVKEQYLRDLKKKSKSKTNSIKTTNQNVKRYLYVPTLLSPVDVSTELHDFSRKEAGIWKETLLFLSKFSKEKYMIHFISFKNAIIGVNINDLVYYFKPCYGKEQEKLFHEFRKISAHPFDENSIQIMRYEPEKINASITSTGYDFPPELKSIEHCEDLIKKYYSYEHYVTSFISQFDHDKNVKKRRKLIELLMKNNHNFDDLNKITENIEDTQIIINITKQLQDKKQIIEEFNRTMFVFDRDVLNKIHNLVYEENTDVSLDIQIHNNPDEKRKQRKNEIRKILQPYQKKVALEQTKTTKVDSKLLADYFELLIDDFLNPLKNKYLLSSMVFLSIPDNRYTKNVGEEVFLKLI